MTKKTYNEKLYSLGDFPKIDDLSNKPETVKRLGGTKILIVAPLHYEIIAKRWQGDASVTSLRNRLART